MYSGHCPTNAISSNKEIKTSESIKCELKSEMTQEKRIDQKSWYKARKIKKTTKIRQYSCLLYMLVDIRFLMHHTRIMWRWTLAKNSGFLQPTDWNLVPQWCKASRYQLHHQAGVLITQLLQNVPIRWGCNGYRHICKHFYISISSNLWWIENLDKIRYIS